MRTAQDKRIAFGDWQTPQQLAEQVLDKVGELGLEVPATVLEPTCGEGAFLAAAAARFPTAALLGYEVNPAYARVARRRVPRDRMRIAVADFFQVNWERELLKAAEPILVIGNPPWVTNARQGVLKSDNLPRKSNFKALRGVEALTGKSNFDVSEWMIVRLLEALQGTNSALAVLCKSIVARRVLEYCDTRRWSLRPGGLFRLNTAQHFGASVDAVLFVGRVGATTKGSTVWPLYDSLEALRPSQKLGVISGRVVPDLARFRQTQGLSGRCAPEWRSGMKHDCARVMELRRVGRSWVNGLDERVCVESDMLYPLWKSSDVAKGSQVSGRAMLVPQRALGEDTTLLASRAPKTWAYLRRHREALEARESAVYRGQPPFAVFGIGEYSFSPWKVAISGLYKRLSFALLGPVKGRPVMLDDTCYFLPFWDELEAQRAALSLRSSLARIYFEARLFWDAKRPINKALLQSLDLGALERELSKRGDLGV